MSLAKAIDDLLAFVPDDQPIPREGERRDRFEALDRAVYVEACRLGLEGKLLPPSPEKLGLTNLPGLWTTAVFVPTGLRAWKNSLLTLRMLAEAGSTPEAETGEQPADPRARPEVSLDARALAVFIEHTD